MSLPLSAELASIVRRDCITPKYTNNNQQLCSSITRIRGQDYLSSDFGTRSLQQLKLLKCPGIINFQYVYREIIS